MKSVGDGKATKIIFPFEITRLVDGVASYLGAGAKIPEHPPTSAQELERLVGTADRVLGEIPDHKELKKELDKIEKEMEALGDTFPEPPQDSSEEGK